MGHIKRKLLHFMIMMLFKLSVEECNKAGNYSAEFCWKRYYVEYFKSSCQWRTSGLLCEHLKDNLHEIAEYGDKLNINRIEVYNSNIWEIQIDSLKDFEELKYLKIEKSRITNIPSIASNNSSKLSNLHLSNNDIETLPQDVFNKLTNLKILDLSHNKIKSIKNSSYFNLLQELYLNNNGISDISFLIDNCNELNYLDLSQNNIESLPLTTCTKLNHLRIGSNKIKQIDPEIFRNFWLEHLDASNNDLSFVNEDTFHHSSSLKYLDLSRNAVFESNTIRGALFKNARHLVFLNLSSTFLEQIQPGTFSFMVDLYILDLSFNNLTCLPKHDGASYLYLNDNRLTNFEYDGLVHAIHLDHNLWSCAVLANLLEKYYQIKFGNTYNTTNINGIACQNSIDGTITSDAHNTAAVMNILLQDYLVDFVHEQDKIIVEFERFKYLISERNQDLQQFSESYLKILQKSFFLRNSTLYFTSFASLLAIIAVVLYYHWRDESQNNNVDHRNLSTTFEI